ncbi:hypothetical protein [Parvicella tangerina]|uniref:Lipoprotein n=1 Tax=Parvicella tangerina TaxID=2829795 RepID=A0A916JLM6_9FLAO|nr:hypothetical protein [Parvicella tangerina]CAG5079648.1 hypothetical protein CRYO30217_00999 [Parvicella tangerina]
MKVKVIPISAVLLIFFSSCAAIFNGVVLPNQCKRCAVYNTLTGDTLEVFEGCGSENTKLEENAKISAFEHIKSTGNCNIDIYCKSWKKDPEEEE